MPAKTVRPKRHAKKQIKLAIIDAEIKRMKGKRSKKDRMYADLLPLIRMHVMAGHA